MTASNDVTFPGPAGPADADQQRAPGSVPALADCFTPRPHTGPGPLAEIPRDECLVLTGPARALGTAAGMPGGTGKTQLAVQLARTWQQENPGGLLLWLDAASRDSILSGYVRAAAAASAAAASAAAASAAAASAAAASAAAEATDSAEAVAARFIAALSETATPWLLVLDGLTDPADAEGLWPLAGESGRLLVTVRDGVTVPESLHPAVFHVGPFSSHEALAYLMARLSADPDQRLGAVDLVDELGCDPLALAQASAAIANSGVNCRDYLDLFVKRGEQADVAGQARAVTWVLSMECADELSPGGAPHACLALAALLGAGGIPESVFAADAVAEFAGRMAAAAAAGSAGSAGSAGAATGRAADDGAARVRAALASLHNAGLLRAEAGLIQVNLAVRAAVLAAMSGALRAAAAAAAAAALRAAWPPDEEARSPLAGALRLCAASLDQAAGDVLWQQGAYQPLFLAAQSLDAAGVTGPAVEHWRAVVSASERVLGAAHGDTQLATARLAAAALTAGLGPEAIAWHHRTLDSLVRHLGADHPRTVAARADYGAALLAVGQPDEAIGILEGVLTTAGGQQTGIDVLATQDTLGAAYQAAGRHKEAIRLTERTLVDRERRQGPDHPDAIRTRLRLARACLAAGRAKDAITHGGRALAGAERVLGPDSPDTVDAVTALAAAYHAARRVKDAISLYERALRDRERVQGPDHPETVGVRGNLASAYHSAGRMASALDLYERTRTDCQRVLGPDHPDTLAARANLAHAYYAMGRLSEARALLAATLADSERVLAPGDPLTTAVRDSLTAMAGA